jgi:membrane protein YdbS with pleckstrin-like domain
MYCIKCGADNTDTAKFCRKCGALMPEVEQETRVAPRRADAGDVNFKGQETGEPVEQLGDGEEETRVAVRQAAENHPVGETPPPLLRKEGSFDQDEAGAFSIRPTLMFVKMGYVLAAVAALLLVAFTSALLSQWVSVWPSILVGLLLFLIPAYYHFRQKLVKYTLTDSILRIDTGLVSRTTRNVPVTRIQDVTVSATPWQRLLGIGDLIFDNASEQGGKLTLKNINSPKKYADVLLKQMRHLER